MSSMSTKMIRVCHRSQQAGVGCQGGREASRVGCPDVHELYSLDVKGVDLSAWDLRRASQQGNDTTDRRDRVVHQATTRDEQRRNEGASVAGVSRRDG